MGSFFSGSGTARRSFSRLGSIALGFFGSALVLAFLAGCSSGDSDGAPPAKEVAVYISGSYSDADWGRHPCFWRNGNRNELSVMQSETSGGANAIVAAGGTIYIAGYSGYAHPIACYWAGGIRYDQAHYSEGAGCIAVNGGTVYTAVNNPYLEGPANPSTYSGMYYVNTTQADELFGEGSEVKGIFAAGEYLLAVGQTNDSGLRRATFWADSPDADMESIALDSGESDACAISGVDGIAYIAGSVGDSSSEKPCYWTLTEGAASRTPLGIDGSYYGKALAVKAAGGLVYTAGWYNDGGGSGDIPCFWEGTDRIDLPKGSYDSHATGIEVLDGIVYVSGWYCAYDAELDGLRMIPCYWTVADGTPARTDLPGVGYDGQATGIAVVME